MKKRGRSEPRRTEPWRSSGQSNFNRNDPRKSDGPYGGPKGPGRPDHRKPSSRYAPPPKVNPVYQDPNQQAPKKQDPRFSAPNRGGHRRPDPRSSGPHRPGPRRPDSRYPDPISSPPRKKEPRTKLGYPEKRRFEPPAPEPVEQAPIPVAAPEPGPNLISGRNPVIEALRAGTTPIEKVFLLAGVKGEGIEKIKTLAKRNGIICTEVGKQKFREFASDTLTQGVVAIVGIKEYVDIVDILSIAQKKNEAPCLLILDEIEDPHNLGALIRTAECAGIHGVVIPKHHAATVNQTVAKTSAGASEHLPVAKVVNIAQTIDELKKEGVWIVGTDDSADKAFTQVDFKVPVAIVIGNEGKGIRQLVREKCDFLVKIPLYGKIGSLNASVAGALVMYEMVKQRKAL